MKSKINWLKILYFLGIASFIIGTLDPLEGAFLIIFGSLLLLISSYLTQKNQFKIHFTAFIMLLFGVIFLFYFSNLGGFGGTSNLSWWWGLLIIPYPIGWLISVVLLFKNSFEKSK